MMESPRVSLFVATPTQHIIITHGSQRIEGWVMVRHLKSAKIDLAVGSPGFLCTSVRTTPRVWDLHNIPPTCGSRLPTCHVAIGQSVIALKWRDIAMRRMPYVEPRTA